MLWKQGFYDVLWCNGAIDLSHGLASDLSHDQLVWSTSGVCIDLRAELIPSVFFSSLDAMAQLRAESFILLTQCIARAIFC